MALHISGKLIALGLVISALITAFSAPRQEATEALTATPVELRVEPHAEILANAAQPVSTPAVQGPTANPIFVLRATGYNSHASQTDATPFITSTGARTRFGIMAVSRDLLGSDLPYGSLVRLRDLGNYHTGRGVGAFQALLDDQIFIVEDTMHSRKTQQVDVWFESYSQAVNWGVRKVEVELIRYGRQGTELLPALATEFEAAPILLAAR
jgi:3D (Asp-Asp-Asp) domain-containing protein